MYNNDVKKVVGALIDMLINNVINDNGSESFQGWCEDGDIFENENQVEIMNKLASCIDTLSILIDLSLDE